MESRYPAKSPVWARQVYRQLRSAAPDRNAVAQVDDGDQIIEVAVAPGGRWRARTATTEWAFGSDGLSSWHVSLAGARVRDVVEPEGWVHPALGLLWPDLLPVWGRRGDRYRPTTVIEGARGPAMVKLVPVGVEGGPPCGALYVDAPRSLLTCVELPGRTWTLLAYGDL